MNLRGEDFLTMAHSTSTLVAGADLEFGTKASMTKQNSGDLKLRQSLWLRRFCYSLVALAFLAFVDFTKFYETTSQIAQVNEALVTMAPSMVPSNGQGSTRIRIEDVVVFDSGEVLVLMRLHPGTRIPSKDELKCRFGDRYTSPVALHKTQEGRGAALLCGPPPAELASWDVSSLTIELNQGQEIIRPREQPGIQWSPTNHVVYEAFSTPDDVVVFVHGMNNTRGEDLNLLRCVFNDETETAVTSQAQEVIRCAHPPGAFHHSAKITVKFDGRSLPSVARYIPLDLTLMRKKAEHHDVCACTMIYNGAKFLDEWVYYHTHLGVTKFFLYDNNSEDDLEGTISSLNDRSFNVVKHPWPWVKTQEAGFSHCSLLARPECEWMLFIDVDEFFFPNRKYQSENAGSQLTKFIADAVGTRPVGQIMTFCNNYGPSMLTSSPAQGVTQGYTCRMARPERHKSIVKLDAVASNLSNVIHHFSLQEGYENVKITGGVAVINHYKFQVWDEFKVKFRRRAATYVADWTEDRNHDSKDRVPDLGTRAVKPPDWEKRYCEVWDYGLRNFTRSVFGSYDDSSFHRLRLAWERSL